MPPGAYSPVLEKGKSNRGGEGNVLKDFRCNVIEGGDL